MGREFQLVKDAVWASKDGPGEPIRAEVVSKTLALMREIKNTQAGEQADLLRAPHVTDPFRFQLNLERATLEPLEAMDFKVLPAHILEKRTDKLLDVEFANNPIGSGPFVYFGRRTEEGREFAIFKANPAYGKRQGKLGLPRIQEIRFVVTPPDPATYLREGKIDMLLDVSTSELVRLRGQEFGLARIVNEQTLPSRRIWMLAINHRKPELGQETGKPLRRALAHAINREEIVQKVFKAGSQNHRALNGPFPPDTWAIPTTPPPASLFKTEYAKTFAKQAKMPERLTLKFTDDVQTRQACQMIKQQIESLSLGVRIDLMPLPAPKLHQDVFVDFDYELAFVPYDFNDTYSLSGLLDPDAVGRGERNFLGYVPEATARDLLASIRSTRNFTAVKGWSQTFYNSFNTDQMPFVPLWQLDFHLLVNQNLKTKPPAVDLDPLTIFDQSEEWRVDR
jgi:ABC-type transport system substrate-binding protein